MSWMNRLEPPESDFTDDEWDQAYAVLVQGFLDAGWSLEEAEDAVDVVMVEEQCVQTREDDRAAYADLLIKRRKEGDW